MARKKKKKHEDEEEEMGWDAEDADEALEAEELKSGELDEGRVDFHDDDGVIETYDEDTGAREGTIVLKDGNEEGLLTVVKISENVDVQQDHYANIESVNFAGKLSVENPSTVDRLWDIDLSLKNKEFTDLEAEQIKIRELGTTEETNTYSQEFLLSQDAKNLLIVKEYINTLENADDVLNLRDIENDLDKLSEKKGKTAAKEEDEEDEDEETLDEDVDIEEEDELDYSKYTVPELKDLCEAREIDIPDGSKKADIIALLEEWDENEGNEDDEEDYEEDYDGAEAEEVSLESFGISISKLNTVTFAIAMKSNFEKPLKDVKLTKNIPGEFENVQIIDTTVGMAEMEGDQIIWSIEELEPEIVAMIKFRAEILVETHDAVKTGLIEVSYIGSSSFAQGFGVDKFDAYTRNKFYVDILERDEEPGVWDCKLVFENTSEFILQLFNADVYTPEAENEKLVDIDPNDVPMLPSGARWESVAWVHENEDYPTFRKKLEFRVMPDFQTEVNSIIKISDVELGLASIFGELTYDIAEIEPMPVEEEEGVVKIPTYKETDINADLKVTNDGSAPLNELVVKQQYFNDEFRPPNLEETVDEETGETIPPEIEVLKDGQPVEIQDGDLRVEDGALIYEVRDLKDRDEGMFDPESMYEFKYPIHASKPIEGSKFESDVLINANTYPKGPELEYRPEAEDVPVIEAIHLRRRYRLGKDIVPMGELGEYQIIITLENVGTTNMPLKDFVIMDKVPDSFARSDFSMEPEVTDLKGEDILKWELETVDEGEKIEITYNIKGEGEYNPSQAQVAY